jgi:predicted nicotinamide N-methyase
MDDLFSWSKPKERTSIRPAKCIRPIHTNPPLHYETIQIDDLLFKKVHFTPDKLDSNLSTDLSKTDLIPDVYEGGFKLWECCVDMIQFLRSKNIELKNKTVLDLGCGVSIPGIYALQQGAIVHFQDYNEEVLEHITIPNVVLNTTSFQFSNATFYSGDWSLLESFIDTKYDIIITTDTLYSIDNHPILANFIQNRLSKTGVCYVGAKSYYFGIGGGVSSFLSIIEKSFDFKILSTIKDGKSNVREIIEMKLH